MPLCQPIYAANEVRERSQRSRSQCRGASQLKEVECSRNYRGTLLTLSAAPGFQSYWKAVSLLRFNKSAKGDRKAKCPAATKDIGRLESCRCLRVMAWLESVQKILWFSKVIHRRGGC